MSNYIQANGVISCIDNPQAFDQFVSRLVKGEWIRKEDGVFYHVNELGQTFDSVAIDESKKEFIASTQDMRNMLQPILDLVSKNKFIKGDFKYYSTSSGIEFGFIDDGKIKRYFHEDLFPLYKAKYDTADEMDRDALTIDPCSWEAMYHDHEDYLTHSEYVFHMLEGLIGH